MLQCSNSKTAYLARNLTPGETTTGATAMKADMLADGARIPLPQTFGAARL